MQQLLWCQGKEFVCEGISFPGKEMRAGKAHCQQILMSTRGKKAISTQISMWEERKGKHPGQEGSLGESPLLGCSHGAQGPSAWL